MKSVLSILLIAVTALACSQSRDYIRPSDQLYKRWKSVEIGRYGKDWRAISPSEVIEFLPDGTIRYENQTNLCCTPVKIALEDKILKVLKTGGTCINGSCVSIPELHILSLSDTELVIDYWNGAASQRSVRYVAAP